MTKKDKKVNHNAQANWLRASVLGAIDGIVSVAGIVVGVAGATTSKPVIMVAGLAGLLAGALSMAAGEYVSVSTQRDIEEKHHKAYTPDEEGEFTNPWHAAIASAVSFTLGSIIPLGMIMLPLGSLLIPATFFSVIIALVITGYWSAYLSDTPRMRAVIRVTLGGIIAMIVTYGIGSMFDINV